MKIDKMRIVNFMGISGVIELELPQIAAIIGKNGMGKTTVMNAIRYALTGAEPEGDIIHKSADLSRVDITLTDPTDGEQYVFTRIKDRTKPSKCKINEKAATQKVMNEKIEDTIGIPLDKVKILSSSEVVASMKPQEFSSFILDYIPEKINLEKVISLIPDTTLGMIEILEANLPEEDIDLDILDEFSESCRYNRKELKQNLANQQALFESKPKIAPVETREEIENALKAIMNAENEYKIYQVKKQAYDNACTTLARHNATINALKADMAKIFVERPNPADLDSARAKEKALMETVQNHKISINGVLAAVKQLEITLNALNKPICPVSPLITCHQDKTVAKEEISESIAASKESIAATQTEMEKTEKELAAVRSEIEKYRQQASLYDRKIQIAKQLKAMEDSIPKIPEKPDEVVIPDVEKEKFQLNAKLKNLSEFEEGQILAAKISALTTELESYESLVKAMAEKGPVRTGIIESYLKVFEDICNEKSGKVRPEINFKFISQDGVVVLMDNGKGAYLPYESLSGGEKAYMIFIIMDMLNALCGTNLLLLDELSVIDTGCFDALLDIVTASASEYDHILLAAVDHEDTVKSVKKRSIPMLDLTKKAEEAI